MNIAANIMKLIVHAQKIAYVLPTPSKNVNTSISDDNTSNYVILIMTMSANLIFKDSDEIY